MTDEERAELTEKSNNLRFELKKWEKDFAGANNGHKASREDIKADPDIAAKYKEYNKTRDILSGKIALAPPEPKLPPHEATPRKRKHEVEPAGVQTISKRLQLQVNRTPSNGIHETPSKGGIHPWEIDPYDSPSTIRNLFTPSKKAIGPTPQKDGVVLGLFDLLQEDGTTPPNSQEIKAGMREIQATPRSKIQNEVSLKHSRTPASAGKRYLLDSFATPLKSKILNGQDSKTPSVSKLHFPTPSFLRRDSQRPLPPVNENDESLQTSPQMVRAPRKPLVRGLSSMLAGLRKLEEEAADDDLDALREMEAEEAGTSKPKPAPKKGDLSVPNILVKDSQQGLLKLGGFDDEAMLDSESEEEKGRDGLPLKVFKKKGQKRTTRRVKMKPTRSKPETQPVHSVLEESEDELAETVPETQVNFDDIPGIGEGRNFDSDSQSEYTASEGGTRYRRAGQRKKNRGSDKEGKVRKSGRKVTALANQNFKRLKLRNSGAKGGPAHNSRFRRKR